MILFQKIFRRTFVEYSIKKKKKKIKKKKKKKLITPQGAILLWSCMLCITMGVESRTATEFRSCVKVEEAVLGSRP